MTKRIFVTATNTDIGKTFTTKLLLQEYASRGFRVGVIKPIETGVLDGVYPDGDELLRVIRELNSEFKGVSVQDIVPISYALAAAPYVASNGSDIDLKKINFAIEKLEKLCDILIIEGAGGLLVPIDKKYKIIDFIRLYRASALLVTHCSLGCINDTLLNVEMLKSYQIKHLVAFNSRESDSSFSKISEPYFRDNDFEVLKVTQDIDTICDVLYNL